MNVWEKENRTSHTPVETENFDVVHRQLRAGHPIVLILSHLGNWELFAQILPRLIGYVRDSTIYQKLGNRFIDEHVRRLREKLGKAGDIVETVRRFVYRLREK